MANFRVDLRGQTAIVTGAGTGIGKAIALALGSAGANVLVNDVNPDHVDTTAEQIIAVGGSATPWQGDICNRFQAASIIEKARELYGRVHILVNAAGVFRADPFDKLDEWDWRRMLDVNITGAFFCSQLLGRVMADEGGGVIVNIASTAGFTGAIPHGVAYSASKAGLIGLTKQTALELAPNNIRVNAVCPANILESDMPAPNLTHIPLNRIGQPDDIAHAVLFLCSDAASFITGQTLIVDGGGTLL